MLLLDEPSPSLDPRQRERLWEFVGGLAEARHRGRLLHPRRRARPSATPTACSCSPTASCCSPARPRELEATVGGEPRLRGARSSTSCTSAATDVRWLLLKDLQILRALAAAGRRCWSLYPVVDRAAGRRSRSRAGPGSRGSRSPTSCRRSRAVRARRRARSTSTEYAPTSCSRRSTRSASTRARRRSRRSSSGEALGALVIPADVTDSCRARSA